jgi:hypothetical protein
MPNPWIEHIKKKMVELNISSYACALSDERVKKSYKKKKEAKQEQSNSIDYKALFAENIKKLRDGNQEELKQDIELARARFKNKPDIYKEEVKSRFPRTYLYLTNPDEYFKLINSKDDTKKPIIKKVEDIPKEPTNIKKMKAQLKGFKENYNDEISKVKDALDNGVKPEKLVNIDIIKYYYREYNKIKKLLENEGLSVKELEKVF